MLRTNAAILPVEDPDEWADAEDQEILQESERHEGDERRDTQRTLPSDARLWGFVKRGKVERGGKPELSESDVSLWLDRERCRFLVVAEKVVKDDLAPVEFIQFVRELRHSTSQVLFKFEIRHDGTIGRPFCVWPS